MGKTIVEIIAFKTKLKDDANFKPEYDAKIRIRFGILNLSTLSSLIVNIIGSTNPEQIWDNVTNLFEHRDGVRTLKLRN